MWKNCINIISCGFHLFFEQWKGYLLLKVHYNQQLKWFVRYLKEKLAFKIEIVACMSMGIEIDVKKLSVCLWVEVIQELTLYLAFMATHLQLQYDFFDA
jgi:hypothetical protein